MNKIKRYVRLLTLLISLDLVVAGCTIPPEPVPTQIQSPTRPPLTMAATLPPQNTPTPTIPFHTDLSCWQTKPLQAGNDIEGSFPLGYYSSRFYYWDVSSFRAKSFPGTVDNTGRTLFQPPDRSYIPFYLDEDKKMNLIFSDKRLVTIDLPPADNYGFLPLLDGKILVHPWGGLIRNPSEDKNYREGIGYTDTFYIYDSKTGSQLEEHSVFLPNFTFFYESGTYHAIIVYSPDGYYMLYLSKSPDGNGKDGYSLLDLSSNQVKWTVTVSKQLEGAIDEGPASPTWKPDGGGLTYIWTSDNEGKEQNFYNVALDGTVSQMTKFEEVFQPGYLLGFNPQWSPDGHYMAFKVRKAPYPSEDVETFIWDDVDKTLLNPCLAADASVPLSVEGVNWSFDSKHIAMSLPNPLKPTGPQYHWSNYILDVPSKIIYELPDDKTMQGYLKVTDNAFSYRVGSWINWEIP